MKLEEIVPFAVSWREAQRLGQSEIKYTRRRFLRGAALTTAGLLALGVFERVAGAHTLSTTNDYILRPNNDCGSTAYPACGGCNTVDRVFGGCCTTYQATECPSGTGYHRHNHGLGYDLRVNKCNASPYDGWHWLHSGCCWNGSQNAKNMRWRCHDGWIDNDESICRWKVSNGDSTSQCPQPD